MLASAYEPMRCGRLGTVFWSFGAGAGQSLESCGASLGSCMRWTGVGCWPVAGDVEYVRHAGSVPEFLAVTYVYGWLLDDMGRCLVQIHDDGHANLPGGTPEPGDAGWVDTLRREAMEENQVVFGDAVFVEYQEVWWPGSESYAPVGMVGLISEFQRAAARPRRWADLPALSDATTRSGAGLGMGPARGAAGLGGCRSGRRAVADADPHAYC